MKYKRLSPWMLSALSGALVLLGFGACKSNKELVQKREALNLKLGRLEAELVDADQQLNYLQKEYENIGRGETVYGGPNNMAEARRRMQERQESQRRSVRDKMEAVQHQKDSLLNEFNQANEELKNLDNK